jgi:hypothetical protein
MINTTMNEEYFGHQYNFKTRRIDLDKEVVIIPNISYKIEF